MALKNLLKRNKKQQEEPSESKSSNCVACGGAETNLICPECDKPMHKGGGCSREWKAERYCKKCYKKVSKKERELMGLATG